MFYINKEKEARAESIVAAKGKCASHAKYDGGCSEEVCYARAEKAGANGEELKKAVYVCLGGLLSDSPKVASAPLQDTNIVDTKVLNKPAGRKKNA